MPITRSSKSLKNTMALFAATASLCLTACGSGGGGASTTSGDVVFGSVISLTGQYAAFGAGVLQGLKAAVASVNDAGGVLGRNATLQVTDDVSDPVDAVPAAKSLVNVKKAVVQVGEAGPDAQAVYKIFSQAKVPFFTAGGDTFFDNNTDPYVWRLTPSDNQLGVAMAVWAYHQGYRNIALLFTAGVQEQLSAAVQSTFTHLGGKIAISASIQTGLSSYTATVGKVVAAHPDAIVAETDIPSMAVVARNMAATGDLNIPIIGTDTMVGAAMLKAVGLSTAQKIMTNVQGGLFNSPASKAFSNAVQKTAHAAPEANANYAYDGVVIAALAMDMAKSTTGATFNADIQKVTAPGGTKVYNYADGQKAIKAGKQITYIGASGPFYFNAHHNVYGPFVAVKPNAKSQYDTVYTISPDAIKQAAA
jgi:ABC-type branched-subunit amino acid transport system substrate-binding protein